MALHAEIGSESAYDALREGHSLVARVMTRPLTLEELAAAEPELDRKELERRLRRLVQTGILKLEEGRYVAAASALEGTRQEGMVTFLSKYMLPHFTRIDAQPEDGFFVQLDLHLTREEQQRLLGEQVPQLFKDLIAASEESANEMVRGLTLVVGTSDVPPPGDPADRMLETVRRCAKQRATPQDASRAQLSHADGTFTPQNLVRARKAVEKLAESLQNMRAEGRKANYTLILGFRVRERMDGVDR